ncbi:S8 family serine peptidase [Bradyrhizobium sp.]|uniref:S8 family peptidase n=1 Tax=Bradyrhizobium sp. TaxID=376 RepID=UPI0027169468|nr:S8 family serine peptidase [Bradyrhizobium sp.]MDO9296407.1 S8 family serine peptidase [Bradyrhizobium sp.]
MPVKNQKLRRYIIMSNEGFLGPSLTAATFKPSAGMVAVRARTEAVVPAPQMRVLDALHENGPKLVEMSAEGELSLRLSMPGVKIVPEVFYHRQWQRFRIHRKPARKKPAAKRSTTARAGKMKAAKAPVAAAGFDVTVTGANGSAIKGAQIVAFTNFATREGASATTGANGRATLKDISPGRKLERVYVYPKADHWGLYATDTTGSKLSHIKLKAINLQDPSLLLTQLYGSLPLTAGEGVIVGIIDSGVDGGHPDLPNVTGGLNCVSDEVRANAAAAADWRPGLKDGEHGTHVAGIVGGRGATSGFRGVAPGVSLRSYRVFPDIGGGASNFDIAKAIDIAVAEGCHIVNMSLGGGPKDDLTRAAINRALDAGTVVIVAAGNDYREPVSFPAALTECVAVSAMGRVGSFPKDAVGTSDIAAPKGVPATHDFVAAFSNFGSEIDVTGAGVEIVSTLPNDGHGSMSGTSMACPAVAGYAAYLLAKDPALKQKNGADRSRALKDALYASCKPQGFGRDYEGFGLPS